jgi:hypothetical protein
MWCEIKTKTRFTWYGKGKRWETGIDLPEYGNYLAMSEQTGMPLWLLFLHKSSDPSPEDKRWGCPDSCPVGLFGGLLSELKLKESHRDMRSQVMVYWAHDSLHKIADYKDGKLLDDPLLALLS